MEAGRARPEARPSRPCKEPGSGSFHSFRVVLCGLSDRMTWR